MILVEILMLSVLVAAGAVSSVYDMKYGIVPNKVMIVSIATTIILSVCYYSIFVRDIVLEFILNAALAALISLLLYGFHVLGGGDSKMLIMIAIGFPARLYGYYSKEYFPVVNLYAIIFSLGFIYMAADSIVMLIKKVPVALKRERVNILSLLKDVLISIIYVTVVSGIISFFFPVFYAGNPILVSLFCFFLVYCIHSFKLFKRIGVIAILVASLVAVFIIQRPTFEIRQLYSYAASIVVILVRRQLEKYNYLIIKPEQLKKGMVLSAGTVLQFSGSKSNNLPRNPSESLKNRLTEAELNAVVLWAGNNKEKPIVIARKIPFAIFILVGMLIFMIWGLYCANIF